MSNFDNESVAFLITNECNLKCPGCIAKLGNAQEDFGDKKYMSIQTAKKSLETAAKHGAKKIILLGGEPTLHPAVVQIASIVKNAGFECEIITNYAKPDVIKQLDGIADKITISNYNQPSLPDQKDFTSKLELDTLLTNGRFKTLSAFDAFIDKYKNRFGSLTFRLLTDVNEWTKTNKQDTFTKELLENCETTNNQFLYKGIQILQGAPMQLNVFPDGATSRTWHRNDKEETN